MTLLHLMTLCFLSCLLLANSQKNSSIKFESYISQLVDIKVIREEELEFLAQKLEKNEIVNPIDCIKIHCDSERTLHYEALESHLDSELDLEHIQSWMQNFLKKRKHDEQKREEAKEETKDLWKKNIPKRISGNLERTCAINKEDKIVCWGKYSPKPIPNFLGPLKEISSGMNFMCALEKNGKVQCWGEHEGKVPEDLGKIVQISTSASWVLTLNENGKIKIWKSWNTKYNKSISEDQGFFVQISVGEHYFCALNESFSVKCWTTNLKPIPLDDPEAVKRVTVGGEYIVIIAEDESAWSYRSDDKKNYDPPKDLGPVVQLAGYYDYICALQKNGIARCWGKVAKTLNEQLFALGPLVQISADYQNVCTVNTKGKVQCLAFLHYEGPFMINQENFTPPPEDLEIYIDDLLPLFDFGSGK